MKNQPLTNIHPPGPTNLEMLLSIPRIRRNPLEYIQRMVVEYGDMVLLPVGSLQVFILNHPEAIKHVLQANNRNYSKDTIQYNALAAITGKGLLTSDGDFWRRQRRLAQPAFHPKRVDSFQPQMVEAARKLLAGWESLADTGQQVDIDQEMMRLALEILGKALLSIDLSQEAEALTGAVMTTLDHIMHRARAGLTLPEAIPTRRNLRFKKALDLLDRVIYEMIAQRQKAQAPPDDLLSGLMRGLGQGPEEGMSLQQLRDELITILIAGHETVASALTWTCFLLAQNADIEERLVAELREVLGERLPTLQDMPNLEYTGRIFAEALRLYPPAWVITRKAVQADEIGGFPIPAGSLIVIGTAAIHRHPNFWDDPEKFNPQRFTPEISAQRPHYAYIPFGGGPRLCIGKGFAILEAQTILASIYQRFHLELAPDQRVEVEPMVTLRPRHGLHMRVHRRD